MSIATRSNEQQLASYITGSLRPILNDLDVIENVVYLLQHGDGSVGDKELIEMLAAASQHAHQLVKPLFCRVREIAYGIPVIPSAETLEG